MAVDSCFVEHNWDGKSLVSFSPFSHISGKKKKKKKHPVVPKKLLLHTVFLYTVKGTLIYELGAYTYMSLFLAKQM